MSTPPVECRSCGEINQPDTLACARCGQPLLSNEELQEHRAQVEQSKREAERESVEYPTLANQVLNRLSGQPRYKGATFSSLSNYRKRIALACVAVPVLIVVVLFAVLGR